MPRAAVPGGTVISRDGGGPYLPLHSLTMCSGMVFPTTGRWQRGHSSAGPSPFSMA